MMTSQLRIQWLESTLAFTREKIKLEHVLDHLLKDLADSTLSIQATEKDLHRLLTKSEDLLRDMKLGLFLHTLLDKTLKTS